MKKSYLFLASAALVFASCANDDFTGNPDNQQKVESGEIAFGGRTAAMTRADHVGSDAAGLLNNNFVVEGVKGSGSFGTYAATNVVFDHYNVNYIASTANKTESNTNDWEYVGQTVNSLTGVTQQTIKYWDYGTAQYDYVAVSLGKGVGVAATYVAATGTYDSSAGITYYSDDQGSVADMSTYSNGDDVSSLFVEGTPASATYADLSTINYQNIGSNANAVYTLTGTTEELASAYIADLVTLYNQGGVSEYGTTVQPKFRRLGTKVRLAFYETVPGYAVGDVQFYAEPWTAAKPGTTSEGTATTTPTIFAASSIFPSATGDGVMSVYFPTVGLSARNASNPDYNQAHVKFAAAGGMTMGTTKTFGALTYNTTKEGAEQCASFLGRSSSTASYAGNLSSDNAYYTVMPLGTSDNIQIRIKYTLYPIDGGSETIVVDNARAVVPADYCDWKPNYAYTYIFKISDNTNGATGVDGSGNIVEGITPITFDAVVVDTEDGIQETITTVSTPSITTYQAGKIITTNNEYVAGDIFASVEGNPVLSAANAHLYIVTGGSAASTVTEATAALAIEQGKSDPSTDTFDKTNVELTQVYPVAGDYVTSVPAADGNTLAVNALRIGGTASTTYVFEYVDGGGNKTYKVIKVQ